MFAGTVPDEETALLSAALETLETAALETAPLETAIWLETDDNCDATLLPTGVLETLEARDEICTVNDVLLPVVPGASEDSTALSQPEKSSSINPESITQAGICLSGDNALFAAICEK